MENIMYGNFAFWVSISTAIVVILVIFFGFIAIFDNNTCKLLHFFNVRVVV